MSELDDDGGERGRMLHQLNVQRKRIEELEREARATTVEKLLKLLDPVLDAYAGRDHAKLQAGLDALESYRKQGRCRR